LNANSILAVCAFIHAWTRAIRVHVACVHALCDMSSCGMHACNAHELCGVCSEPITGMHCACGLYAVCMHCVLK
jgi:hypothetical protein